jgi:hypothetical protein
MRITKTDLKQMVVELLEAQEEDPAKIVSTGMSGAAFGQAGKESRLGANPELSNLERGIVEQIDQFLLKLASTPGVELNTQKAVIQRVLTKLQNTIAKTAKQEPQAAVQEFKKRGNK